MYLPLFSLSISFWSGFYSLFYGHLKYLLFQQFLIYLWLREPDVSHCISRIQNAHDLKTYKNNQKRTTWRLMFWTSIMCEWEPWVSGFCLVGVFVFVLTCWCSVVLLQCANRLLSFSFCFICPGRHNITMAYSALQIKKLLKKLLLKITLPPVTLAPIIYTHWKDKECNCLLPGLTVVIFVNRSNLTCNLSVWFHSFFSFFLIQIFVCLGKIPERLNTTLEEINNFLSWTVLSLCMQIVKYIVLFF